MTFFHHVFHHLRFTCCYFNNIFSLYFLLLQWCKGIRPGNNASICRFGQTVNFSTSDINFTTYWLNCWRPEETLCLVYCKLFIFMWHIISSALCTQCEVYGEGTPINVTTVKQHAVNSLRSVACCSKQFNSCSWENRLWNCTFWTATAFIQIMAVAGDTHHNIFYRKYVLHVNGKTVNEDTCNYSFKAIDRWRRRQLFQTF